MQIPSVQQNVSGLSVINCSSLYFRNRFLYPNSGNFTFNCSIRCDRYLPSDGCSSNQAAKSVTASKSISTSPKSSNRANDNPRTRSYWEPISL